MGIATARKADGSESGLSANDNIADVEFGANLATMEHASLVAFLEGRIAPEQFGGEVAEEVSACEQACRAQGQGRISITDGPDTIVTRDHAKRLLEAVAGQRLSLEIGNYTASCIIFGDFEFADDAVNEAVWLLEMADLDKPTFDELRTAAERLAL